MRAPGPRDTAVIGAGRLARALIPLLGRAGYRVVSVAARRSSSARAASRGSRGARPTTSLSKAAERARLILLAVPDRSLAEVAKKLATAPRVDWKQRTVLHHAGALGLEVLAPLSTAGASVGVLHPLQCLGTARHAAEVLPGSRARIEGDRRGRATAARLARDLGLDVLRLGKLRSPADRVAYHAAASIVANDLVALLDIGADLLESIGASHRGALEALLPLVRGTLLQVEREGLRGALTGPVARGDLETYRAHLESLSRRSTRSAEIHRLLSRRLAEVVERRGGRLPAETRARLRRLLRSGAVGRGRKPAV